MRSKQWRIAAKWCLYILAGWYGLYAVALAFLVSLHLAAESGVLAYLLAWLGGRFRGSSTA